MMKGFLALVICFVLMTACEKENDSVQVEYRVVNGYSETGISWRGCNEIMHTTDYLFTGAADTWNQKIEVSPGQIVYLAGIYHDTASAVTLQIMIDGKLFRQKSSKNEPGKYLVVSGTVPY